MVLSGDDLTAAMMALKGVLENNGTVAVGMAAGVESLVPEKVKIPIFINSASANNTASIMRLAKAAYLHIMKTAGQNRLCAVSAYCSYAFGLIAAKGAYANTFTFDSTSFGKVDWDSEVQFVNETVDMTTSADSCALPPEDASLIPHVLSCIFAGKMTWFAQRHHLGSDDKKKNRSGYLAKVIDAVSKDHSLFEVDWHDPSSASKIYNFIHPPSSLRVIQIIHSGQKYVSDLRTFTLFPMSTGDKFVPIEPEADVTIRVSQLMAGYASLGDIVAALKMMKNLPFFPAMPGLDKIKELSDEYEKVKKNPFRYGISAHYLTNNPSIISDRFDKDIYSFLIASCTAYVKCVIPQHSLASSALFNQDPTTMVGFDNTWYELCSEYVRYRSKHYGNALAFLTDLGATGSAKQAPTMSPALKAQFDKLGFSVDSAEWDARVDIINRSAGTAPPPPAAAPPPAAPGAAQAQAQAGLFNIFRNAMGGAMP